MKQKQCFRFRSRGATAFKLKRVGKSIRIAIDLLCATNEQLLVFFKILTALSVFTPEEWHIYRTSKAIAKLNVKYFLQSRSQIDYLILWPFALSQETL
jgi:hypothetical protein